MRRARLRGAAHQGRRRDLADLVRSTLRLRPDRIIVGEVRGPEALDMLKAWNTGHPGGIATVHANSARRRALPARAADPGESCHRAAPADRRGDRHHRLHHRPRHRRAGSRPSRASPASMPTAATASSTYPPQCSTPLRRMTMRRTIAVSRRRHSLAACSLACRCGHAAAGTGMPWEQPLQQILDSVQGPVAKIMAVIVIIVTGLTCLRRDRRRLSPADPDRVRPLDRVRRVELLPVVLQLRRRSARR